MKLKRPLLAVSFSGSCLLIVLMIITYRSCAQNAGIDASSDPYTPRYTAAELTEKLVAYYTKNQTDSLAQFFTNWNSSIPTNSNKFITQNDTIKAVFEVYKAFYKPLDLLKLGDWEWGNKLNEEARYIVVNPEISFQVLKTDSVDNTGQSDREQTTIPDFRPPVDLKRSQVLYLMPEYDSALRRFLGDESTEVGEGNIMNPSLPKGESEKRYQFLRPWIPILHGHWGGWHLATHPAIYGIRFNKQLTKAFINFRVGYQGGEATLVKKNGTWKIEKSGTSWIE